VIDQLQVDFINQALELLEATRDWAAVSQPRRNASWMWGRGFLRRRR
jgi:hypothetical protein